MVEPVNVMKHAISDKAWKVTDPWILLLDSIQGLYNLQSFKLTF
jgi:hypothetical protein